MKEITMQDVRLHAGEGPLNPFDVLAACNAVLRNRDATAAFRPYNGLDDRLDQIEGRLERIEAGSRAWGSWVRSEWNADEPACVRCHTPMSLRDGCEWSQFPELNLCDGCALIVLEELRPNSKPNSGHD